MRRGHAALHNGCVVLLALLSLQCCAYMLIFHRSCPPSVFPDANTTSLASDSPGFGVNRGGGNRDDDDGRYALASSQSHGFFYDVSDGHWNKLREIYLRHSNHLNPERPLMYNPENPDRRGIETWGPPEMFSSYKAWYQSNYEPNFSCQFEKRIGSNMNGDGPKWICDPHRIKKLAADRKRKDPSHPGCIIYSIGSAGSFVFELGMQDEMGAGTCEFHIFDFGDFEKKVPKELERAHYHRWGLQKQDPGGEDDPAPGRKFYGLQDTVKLLGHEKLDTIDVFKIDCEKCEWETYMDWIADDVPNLQQIQVEVHGAPAQTAVDFFDNLEAAGYLRFHKEPNIQYNAGCIEYAFVRVDKAFMEGKNTNS